MAPASTPWNCSICMCRDVEQCAFVRASPNGKLAWLWPCHVLAHPPQEEGHENQLPCPQDGHVHAPAPTPWNCSICMSTDVERCAFVQASPRRLISWLWPCHVSTHPPQEEEHENKPSSLPDGHVHAPGCPCTTQPKTGRLPRQIWTGCPVRHVLWRVGWWACPAQSHQESWRACGLIDLEMPPKLALWVLETRDLGPSWGQAWGKRPPKPLKRNPRSGKGATRLLAQFGRGGLCFWGSRNRFWLGSSTGLPQPQVPGSPRGAGRVSRVDWALIGHYKTSYPSRMQSAARKLARAHSACQLAVGGQEKGSGCGAGPTGALHGCMRAPALRRRRWIEQPTRQACYPKP
jgi:hypothetical protein